MIMALMGNNKNLQECFTHYLPYKKAPLRTVEA